MNTPGAPSAEASIHADAAIDNQHPWLGLASFTEETRQYFYGREEEVGELSRRVQRKLLTVLFGQSGLGKTSILNAGIVPRLRPEGYCPVYVRVDYGTAALPPSEQIKQAIFRATEAQGTWTKSGSAIEGESLWEFLHHRDDELRDEAGQPIIPLLIFDQFEEIFTLAQADDGGRKRAAEFIEDLADLVENRPPKALEAKIDADDSVAERFDFARADYRILISLREDYLAHLEGVKGAMPSITQNRMRLARMNGEQALAAVMKPGGKLVTQEVAESIVRFVAGGAELRNAEVEPSLLSLICRELNNARLAQNKSEISVDLIAGSNETILAEFYERALADQPAAVRKVIEDDLLTDSGYRENLAEERVLKAFTAAGAGLNNYADAATTLSTLVNRRLLRIEERLDIRRVELTHDVLCGVVKASREERLEREALEQAEKQLVAQRAVETATRKALIRARQIAAGCAALAVFAIGSAVFGYFSTERAKLAEAEAVKTRIVSEASRGEAEQLLEFLLDDFLVELGPMGRSDVVASLAKRTLAYYEKLPPEARSTVTQRNSANAKAVYASILNTLGKADDAKKQTDEASATIKSLRAAGDNSDETLITEAVVGAITGQTLTQRGDQSGAILVYTEALERLKPALAKTAPPIAAASIQTRLYSSLGFSLTRAGRRAEGIDALQRSRSNAQAGGALALTSLAATSIYVNSGWLLGESLRRLGRPAESKVVLEETVALADKLLDLRPGHRTALNSKAIALGGLSSLEGEQLRVASQLAYLREGLKIQQELSAREVGNSVSQNNLRVTYARVGLTLYLLGRVDDAQPFFQKVLAIGKDERVDGFSASNLVNYHGNAALYWASSGEMSRANAEMANAERYLAVVKAAGSSERSLASMQASMSARRAEMALVTGGDLLSARNVIESDIASISAVFKGDKAAMQNFEQSSNLYRVAAELSLALGQTAAAELHASDALVYRSPEGVSALSAQYEINEIRVQLAIALAQQAKREEANTVLAPVLAFYRLPLVQQSDDQTIKLGHARTLLAAALANPGERGKYLAGAAERFDAMPASLKRLKNFARVREQIAAEMKK